MEKNLKKLERTVSNGVSEMSTSVPKIVKRNSVRARKIVSDGSSAIAKNSKSIGKSLKKAEKSFAKSVNRVTKKVLPNRFFGRQKSRRDDGVSFDRKSYVRIFRKICRDENEYVKLLQRFIGTYYDVLVDPRHVGPDFELMSELFLTLSGIVEFHRNFALALKQSTKDFDKPEQRQVLTEFFVSRDRKFEFLELYRKYFETLLQKVHAAIKRTSNQDPNFLQFLIDAKEKDKDDLSCNDFLMKPKERMEVLKTDLYNAIEKLEQGPGFMRYNGPGHPDKESVNEAYNTVCEVVDIAFKRGVYFRSKLESLKKIV